MLEQAQRDLGSDLGHSFVIGDRAADIEMGRRVGATTILVLSDTSPDAAAAKRLQPDSTVADLPAAAMFIAARLTGGTGG